MKLKIWEKLFEIMLNETNLAQKILKSITRLKILRWNIHIN